jgi:cardiolipin synthase
MTGDVVHLVVTIATFVLAGLLIATVLVQHRPPGTTFAWLLAILLIPYVGVPLYLIFGGRKLRPLRGKAQLYTPTEAPCGRGISGMLCRAGAPPPRPDNAVVTWTTGEAAYAAVIDAFERAEHSIHVSTLILGRDEVGAAILDVLERKARAGVEVRLLLDWLYKWRASPRRLRRLRRAGGRVAWFMPAWHVPLVSRLRTNLRLHRKIIVVDGKLALIGGMNLAREYMGPTPSPARWRDLMARIDGPAVADVAAVFRADWAFAARESLEAPAALPEAGGATVQVVGSGPDVPEDLVYDAFLSAVFEARRRLWIATPYFVPDEGLARAIVLAARRGVDVRIVVPARSNHATADLAGASYLREVEAAGGTICCYAPGMMHAKCVLVDDRVAVIGSANVDMRSLFLNYEIALFLWSPGEVAALAGWFDSLWPTCGRLRPASRVRFVVESIARLIGPLE